MELSPDLLISSSSSVEELLHYLLSYFTFNVYVTAYYYCFP